MKRILFLSFFAVACATMKSQMYSLSDKNYDLKWNFQRQELLEIDKLNHQKKSQDVLQKVASFRQKNRETPYYQASRLIEARAYYDMEQYQKALDVYEAILIETASQNEELWARARYESALCQEALGDPLKALALLLELERSSRDLPQEISMALLPVRIAALYMSMGRTAEAETFVERADLGVNFLMTELGTAGNKPVVSETLYRMGTIPFAPLTSSNFSNMMQVHMRSQVYLLRTMELDDPIWAARAHEDLVKIYKLDLDFINTEWKAPEDKASRIQGLKDLHRLITESFYRRPTEAALWTASLKEFFSFAEPMEKQVSRQLMGQSATAPQKLEHKNRGLKKVLPVKKPTKKVTKKTPKKNSKKIQKDSGKGLEDPQFEL